MSMQTVRNYFLHVAYFYIVLVEFFFLFYNLSIWGFFSLLGFLEGGLCILFGITKVAAENKTMFILMKKLCGYKKFLNNYKLTRTQKL